MGIIFIEKPTNTFKNLVLLWFDVLFA
jgi:hypothetical protein